MSIKKVSDYYEILYKKFPQVPKEDIRRILNYGWKTLYLHNSYGGDTLIKDNDIWCYIGYLKKDSIKYFHYYIKKLVIKLRVLYRRKKVKWNGYYYFALSDSQYDNYLQQKNKRGRPKKNFTFEKVFMYQILDECKIVEHNRKYIFRIPYVDKVAFKFYVPELITDKAELIITRDPLKFTDILTSNNDYDFL